MEWLVFVLIGITTYIVGSVSFSYIFTKQLKHQDIREKGSGNAGTTNVLRSYGWGMGILTLLCDLLKGVAAVFVGMWIGGLIAQPETGMYIAGVCVIAGHNWSVFLKFKGGKGIATTTGVLLVLMPVATLIVFGVSVLIVYITKFMSVGSIVGIIASLAAAFILQPANIALHITVLLIAAMGLFSHRENMKRLLHGTENKLSISSNKNK